MEAGAQAEAEAEAEEEEAEAQAEAQAEVEAVEAVEVEAIVHRGVHALYKDDAAFLARFDGFGYRDRVKGAGSVARHLGLYIR